MNRLRCWSAWSGKGNSAWSQAKGFTNTRARRMSNVVGSKANAPQDNRSAIQKEQAPRKWEKN